MLKQGRTSCVKKLGADYIQGYYYGKPVCLQDLNST